MPKSIWKLHLNATSERSAQKIIKKCIDVFERVPISLKIEKYNKGGYMATLELAHDENYSWSELVLEIIALGQRLGSGWSIYGNINDDPSAVLSKSMGNHIRVSGVDWADWLLLKDQF
ncbi:hypothetical protein [uncultured Acinetobacter sp.]|uniref:hypothetical protein n=1 Tax=uncultured Acinetobacter sp. TaxID=165433 RepID=UPI0025E826D4|nr:hypothetical protein [uncultured Acinetobacter sp.]